MCINSSYGRLVRFILFFYLIILLFSINLLKIYTKKNGTAARKQRTGRCDFKNRLVVILNYDRNCFRLFNLVYYIYILSLLFCSCCCSCFIFVYIECVCIYIVMASNSREIRWMDVVEFRISKPSAADERKRRKFFFTFSCCCHVVWAMGQSRIYMMRIL